MATFPNRNWKIANHRQKPVKKYPFLSVKFPKNEATREIARWSWKKSGVLWCVVPLGDGHASKREKWRGRRRERDAEARGDAPGCDGRAGASIEWTRLVGRASTSVVRARSNRRLTRRAIPAKGDGAIIAFSRPFRYAPISAPHLSPAS
jgi:hypothetical protein